jgi:ATP-binding cassette, subfamily C, bacteriocin exporter
MLFSNKLSYLSVPISGMVKIKQQDIKDCGIACLASVGQHYGLHISLAKIRQWAQTDLQGTNLMGMLHAASCMGLEAKALRGTRQNLSHVPLPAIVHGIIENKLTHFMVLDRFNDNQVYVMDPTDGLGRKMSWEEFGRFWTGIIILLKPGENFEAYQEKSTSYARIWELIQPYKFRFFSTWLLSLVYTALGLSMSLFVQQLSDVIIPQKQFALLQSYSAAMFGILLLQFALQAYKTQTMLAVGQQLDLGIMRSYFSHIFTLPQRFFDTFRVGEIMSRVSDAVKIRQFINEVLMELFLHGSIVLSAYALLFWWDNRLAWLMLALIPLHAVIYGITNRWNRRQERQMMENTANVENYLVESISRAKTVKMYGIHAMLQAQTETLLHTFLGAAYTSKRINYIAEWTVQCMRAIFILLLLWQGSRLVMQDRLSMGELFALFALYNYFSGPLAQLIQVNKSWQAAKIASERLYDILDTSMEDMGSRVPQNLETALAFQHVNFQYGFRKHILQNVTLACRRGEFTGIVGESGSGKSTLFHLMQKLYPIQSGRITWNGESIERLSTEVLRQKIACVPQEIELFNGSIAANIALGDTNPNLDRIKQIADVLGLAGLFKQFDHGLETLVGDHGIALSGGQKQRLGVARALYRQPEVILLDEATAALDLKAEMQVLRAIRERVDTVVLISHRMLNFQDAHCIYVMEEGTCIEAGSHSELMREGTAYFALQAKQNGQLV